MNASRRGFIKSLGAGFAAASLTGCKCPFGCQKIKLAVVGVMGKGYTDWTPMLRSGLVEIVAFCDADYRMREKAQMKLIADGMQLDMSRVPFYTDYRRLLDDADILGIEAMTVSTPDHAHAPIAITAMKKGIHVFVQKPLVRTLWELDYFNRTAKEYGVITQMGNQASSLDTMRRSTEVVQSGILGEVREVHVWTDRPVWPQGLGVANFIKNAPKEGDAVPEGLDWNAWLGTAERRPFRAEYPAGMKFYDPFKIGRNVYHTGTWRGHCDFGAGAFGDMACHTMNLPFRGLELGGVSGASLEVVEERNDIAYPTKSKVKLVYKARESKARPGVTLPEVALYWYDGNIKPPASIMPKWAATHNNEVPKTGCYLIGSKGSLLLQDDYGARCAIALEGDKQFASVFEHEAAKAVPRSIPFRTDSAEAAGGKSIEMKGFAEGHYVEFLQAIRGEGPVYAQTHSRCFSDVDYAVPQMEGILVGCVAQRVGGDLKWDSAAQAFDRADANALVRPFIRKGFEF